MVSIFIASINLAIGCGISTQLAPMTNLFELFELLDRYQSEMIDFFVL